MIGSIVLPVLGAIPDAPLFCSLGWAKTRPSKSVLAWGPWQARRSCCLPSPGCWPPLQEEWICPMASRRRQPIVWGRRSGRAIWALQVRCQTISRGNHWTMTHMTCDKTYLARILTKELKPGKAVSSWPSRWFLSSSCKAWGRVHNRSGKDPALIIRRRRSAPLWL